MLSSPPHKLSFEAFIQTCTPLLKIADLEAVMRQRVQEIVVELLDFQPTTDAVVGLH
ncbi:MAG: hypothetical protein ACK44E_11305 [Anaerolineales bacterium]